MALERLHKVMAHAGIASRRACEAIITAGRVRVNGEVVTHLGARVDPEVDRIEVDGEPIQLRRTKTYLAVHKPRGVLSTVSDPHDRPTVMDIVKGFAQRVYPVGRLDRDSEGLLLMTDDGELAFRLTHPRHHVPKVYRVTVAGRPGPDVIERLRSGVELEDGRTAPARVRALRLSEEASELEITLYQGKKRQVRRMCEAVGHPVRRLLRVRVGPIALGDLRPGEFRKLTPDEIEALQQAVGVGRSAREFTAARSRAKIRDKRQDGKSGRRPGIDKGLQAAGPRAGRG